MDRRELLSILGGGAGLAALGTSAWAQAPSKGKTGKVPAAHADGEDHHGDHNDHLQTMAQCAGVCNKTAHHCLGELRKGAEDRELYAAIHEATMDCQAFCVLAATLMARKSPMAAYAHAACADACRDCAAACEKAQSEVVKECAEVCRKCEKMCRQAASKKAGGKHAVPGK